LIIREVLQELFTLHVWFWTLWLFGYVPVLLCIPLQIAEVL